MVKRDHCNKLDGEKHLGTSGRAPKRVIVESLKRAQITDDMVKWTQLHN